MGIEAKLSRLRKYNLIMGVFHLIQGTLILILSNTYSLPIRSSFLHSSAGTNTSQAVTEDIVHLQIGPLVAAFLFISALAHFFVSSIGFGWYSRNLKRGINYARWVEYAFSASLMLVLIAMLSGVFDIAALFGIFALTAAMNLFGLMMEIHNQTTQKTNWTAFYCGCIAGIAPWIGIFIYFVGAANSGPVPTFVYFIMGSLFFLYSLFAINMALQYKKVGPWKDYLFGEAMYVLLSLTAKSVLAWQVFGGAMAGAAS
ncbi:MAG: heliorhodopsin HeR [Dehalococcoidia bacterium]|nr:heliorhodopsin HeR [Dehalococcoidia bacterium]